ncbi:hypothetical protein [Microbacterium sp.]|uniref:hypothetical protein n=1 Tax=Microbacterium sp. TaxID=51671 RepID=UPI0039E502B1
MTRRPRSLESILARLDDVPAEPFIGSHPILRTADLRAVGLGKGAVRAAVDADLLIRVRNGRYLRAGAPADVTTAARAGARVACLSLLQSLGVFVLTNDRPHIHLPSSATRPPSAERVVRHWRPLMRSPHPRATAVDIVDALAQSVRCQPQRAAVATLDSALHLGLIREDDVDEIFAQLPSRFGHLRDLVDGRAESGPESIVRLIALELGFSVDVQVRLTGVGRVDLVLDGWLVVECDSEEFHTGWDSQLRDRRRDLACAGLGLASLRPVAEDILYHQGRVKSALRGLRDAHAAQTPGNRARRRARPAV